MEKFFELMLVWIRVRMFRFHFQSETMKKDELIQKLEDAELFEEDIVLEMEEFYKEFLESSKLKRSDKKSVLMLVNILYKESKHHKEELAEIVKYIHKSKKDEF